jgi:integrase
VASRTANAQPPARPGKATNSSQHPLRHTDRAAQLQPLLGRPLRKADVRKITVHDGRRSCGTLLADPDVHPRVAMQILRHAAFELTMEIYTLASSAATRDALKHRGDSLDGPR